MKKTPEGHCDFHRLHNCLHIESHPILSVNPTNQASLNRTLQIDAVDARGIPRAHIRRQETSRRCRSTF